MPVLLAGLAVTFASPCASAADEPPRVETSAAATTRLYVKTLPPGARVTLDGTPLGASDGLFLVPAGTAKVSVQFDGAEPQVRQVEIAEGRITRVEIDTNAAPGPTPPRGADPRTVGAAPAAQPVPAEVAARDPDVLRLTSQRPPVAAAPLSAIDGVLDAPLKQALDFKKIPLRAVVDQLAKASGIDVLVDLPMLTDAGVDLDAMTVTCRVAAGLPLAAVLDMVLRDAGLTWIVRDEVLEITTPERAVERQIVRVHDVSSLAATNEELLGLADLVVAAVDVVTWNGVGGPGVIRPDAANRNTLVVSNAWSVQRRVAGFLDVIRRLEATPVEKRRPLAAAGYWSDAPAVVAARAALEKPVDIDFQEMPLRAVTAELAKKAGVPIGADIRVLTDAGLDLDATTVTLALAGKKPIAVLLDRMLDPMGLTVEVWDEGLVVTTKEKAWETMSVAFYPLDRLVGGGRMPGSLVTMVQELVMPQTWDTAGGPGMVRAIDGGVPCLVIRQSTAGHRAVEAFLKSLPTSEQPGDAPSRE